MRAIGTCCARFSSTPIGRRIPEGASVVDLPEGENARAQPRRTRRADPLYDGFAGESLDDDSREYVFVARRD
jgi:hypothetical protein